MKIFSVRSYARIVVALSVVACVFLFSFSAYAFISPKRVIIKDNQRTARIVIVNRGNKTNAYSFEWQQRAQANGGIISLLADGELAPGYSPVSEYLVFSPRRMILGPGERQTIRIFVRRGADMEEGEYHSHLLIKADPVKSGKAVVDNKDGAAVGGVFQMHSYASLPVFMHHGATNVSVSIKDVLLHVSDGREFFKFELENSSTRSLYLQPEITCTNANGEEVNRVTLNTIRLYSEAQFVTSDIPVPNGHSFVGCVGLHAKLLGTTDFEYNRKSVAEAPVRKN